MLYAAAREGEDPGDEWTATMAQFAETADGLHPAERLLDQFAFPLTDRVARMSRGASVDRAPAPPTRGVRDEMRRRVHPAKLRHFRGVSKALSPPP